MPLYREDNRTPLRFRKGDDVTVCGIAPSPKRDGPLPPKRWCERGFNVEQWTRCRAAVFPALEEPELVVENIRRFFRTLRPD